MSAQPYEPFHLVAPSTVNQPRMGWLLQARRTARLALDAALAAPRKAVEYVSRIAHKLHLDRAVSWLRGAAAWLLKPVSRLTSTLGRTGVLAAATGVVTSPTGRAALNVAGRALGKLFGWTLGKLYSGLDRTLRCFGKPGNKAADKLFSGIVALGGKIATIAGPVVHRVARLSDPHTTHARVLSGISQSYVVHKLLKALIGNSWLRLLVEAVLLPAALDSRVVARTRTALREARTRAHKLQEQTQVLADLQRQQQAEDQPLLVPDDVEDIDVVTTVDEPVPANRAERRAAQRQGKRPSTRTTQH